MTILTPKGYSSARRPSSERPEPVATPAAPAAATPTPSPAPAQPAAGAGRQQIKLRFPPQVAGMTCPSCGTPYPVQIFSIIDVGQDPILKNLFLSGQINVAVCPRCGAGGAISSPLLLHDPAHNFLGVYVPEQLPINKQQEVIGQLSKRLMDGLPPEDRRGYMLTPKQFLTYQSFVEAVLETEGITREMLDKQRRQLQLVEQALTALQDTEGFRRLVQERDAEMDDEFFGMIQALITAASSGGDEEGARSLVELRERLIEQTTWGKGVQKQRAAIAQLKPETTTSQLVDMVVAAEDERTVDALVTAGRPLVNYMFYQELTQRSEAAAKVGNQAEANRLAALRDHILDYSKKLDELQQAIWQQASQMLSEILSANDLRQAVLDRAPYIDDNFLSVLAANLQRAEQQGATAALERLREVWDAAVAVIQEDAPPEIRLINDLLSAEYPAETRQMLAKNRDLVNDDLIAAMAELATQLEGQGEKELATRLRQIRSQAQLMQ